MQRFERFKQFKRWALFPAAIIWLAGTGCVYLNVVSPLDTDLHQTKLGSKVGTSQAQSVLGLIAWGDAGTQAAAKNGGITTLNHADTKSFAILGFVYTQTTTVVYGD